MRRPPERNVALSKLCFHCGATFAPLSNRARYCSIPCNLSANSVAQPNGCILWVGPAMPTGYGTLQIDKVKYVAHRLAYETFVGPIPDGLFACHRCDTPACINVDHLFLGACAENMADCARKGRQARKLTDEEVRQIRSVVGGNRMYLGRLYGVSDTMIRKIQEGEWWRHLPDE